MTIDPTPYRERTDAKIDYARLMLAPLQQIAHMGGTNFERAHEEAFFFHLRGAQDAFLIELNIYYNAGLDLQKISAGKLRNALAAQGRQSPELAELYQLEQDSASWYHRLKEMRDWTTHFRGVPRMFFVGGENDGQVRLRGPVSATLTDRHLPDELAHWLALMEALIGRLRSSAQTNSSG